MAHLNLSLEPCLPPFWAKGGHAQTILAHLIPSDPKLPKGERLEIRLPDGETLVAFLHRGTSDTVVSVFHGISSESGAHYMQRTAAVALAQGHSVILANHRGCGAGRGLASQPYHSGRAEDLSAVIARSRELFPEKKQIAIGYSLSANALLLLLSGHRGEVKPDAAIAVNGPIQLEAAAKALTRGANRIYDTMFVQICRTEPVKQGHHIPRWITLHEMDELYTARAAGFESREHYYETCSTAPLLKHIDVPTLLLTAADDPFVDVGAYRKAELSSQVHLHIEPRGGHMGYLSRKRTPLGTRRWLDYAVNEGLKALRTQLLQAR